MIQVESLTKDYAGRRGIQDVTFSVEKGEIVGFLGPNGAGKTTTMRILTGYLPPTSGHATVAGFDIETESLDVRRHIGYMPEAVPLYKDLKVRDYLMFVSRLRDIPKNLRREKIGVAMEKTNVDDVADVAIGKLSKGYRQRVGLAQAVIHEPDLVILDEPTEGLDPLQRTETRALIRDLAKEHTVLLSTHILPEVETTCDRILIINEGLLVASDTPEGLSGQVKSGQRLDALVVAQEDHVRLALQEVEGINSITTESMPEGRRRVVIEGSPDVDLRKQVSRALVNADIDLIELKSDTVSLEDIFLRLTHRDSEAASGEDEESERTAGAAGGAAVIAAGAAETVREEPAEDEAAGEEPAEEEPVEEEAAEEETAEEETAEEETAEKEAAEKEAAEEPSGHAAGEPEPPPPAREPEDRGSMAAEEKAIAAAADREPESTAPESEPSLPEPEAPKPEPETPKADPGTGKQMDDEEARLMAELDRIRSERLRREREE